MELMDFLELSENQLSPATPTGEATLLFSQLIGDAALAEQKDAYYNLICRGQYPPKKCSANMIWLENSKGRFVRVYSVTPMENLEMLLDKWVKEANANGGPYGKNITMSARTVKMDGTVSAAPDIKFGPGGHNSKFRANRDGLRQDVIRRW